MNSSTKQVAFTYKLRLFDKKIGRTNITYIYKYMLF